MFQLALLIATTAHAGQYDKFTNEPYILHPIQVAQDENLCDLDKVIAILHDVYEDSPRWIPIVENCFPHEVTAALKALTHAPHVPYIDYVTACRDFSHRTRRVKTADVQHNYSRTLAMPESPTKQRLISKYFMAQDILEGDLT